MKAPILLDSNGHYLLLRVQTRFLDVVLLASLPVRLTTLQTGQCSQLAHHAGLVHSPLGLQSFCFFSFSLCLFYQRTTHPKT